MKITITDRHRTVSFENNEPLTEETTRKVIDMLFSPESNTLVVTGPLTCPADPVAFRNWLTEHPADRILKTLNKEIRADLTQYPATYRLVRSAPQVADLGYPRFVSLVKWLHFQRHIQELPQHASLRTYYNYACRLNK
jgi:hypothetical protein